MQHGDLSRLPGTDNVLVGTLDLETVNLAGESDRIARQRVHYVSNPCTLKINELVLSITSVDVLLHLGLTEASANLPPGSRMERLSQHLLQQQSFYPLFPPYKGTNIDLKKMAQFSMDRQPDIIITPSKLNPFARTVLEQTLVVNPGVLAKADTGGTYATIQVHPIKRDTLESVPSDDVELAHTVTSRSRVEIMRI